ncbi:MAG TPA: winged helix-turn-helix domain-containing protein [Candidatus Limnocylindria bacterium]|nr:winged helix-turn-helix domain-containing protein [Candidatus Limnocylindria bacterium]
MKVITTSSPFGSYARTRVLLALHLLAETYARELARLLGLSLSGVQKALQSLERDGLIANRAVGRTRLYRLSPRAPARQELERYLARLLELEDELRAQVAGLRRRPRSTGKPL